VNATFDKAVADAVRLLRELRRHRHATRDTQVRFQRFKSVHPGLQCRLLAYPKPGSGEVDYDILLTIPQAGAVLLYWQPDDGIPWTPRYADHWAANYVLSVDDRSTSIQSALLYLSAHLKRRPDLMRDLVDRSLIFAAIEEAPPEVSDAEVEDAVDAFRAAHGLMSAAATQQWLDEMQLTMDALHDLVAQSVQARKFKESATEADIRPYFAAHRRDFDRLTVLRLEGLRRREARVMAAAWCQSQTCPALDLRQTAPRDPKGRLDKSFAWEVPVELRGQPVGAVIGPVSHGRQFWVAQVLRREPARLDRATRGRIGDLLFRQWLSERRSRAAIRWHWV
jgi:putative peptide maturation system protein